MAVVSPESIVGISDHQPTLASCVQSTGLPTQIAAAQFKSSITRERLEEVSFQCKSTNILSTFCSETTVNFSETTATQLLDYWNVVHTPVTLLTFVFQLLLQVALLTDLVWVQYLCFGLSPFAVLWYIAFVARLNARILAIMMTRFEFVFPVTHLCCALVAGIFMYDNWLKRMILVQYIMILSSGLLTDAAVVATRVRMFPATISSCLSTAAAMAFLYLSPSQHVYLDVGFLPRHINITLFFVDRLVTLQIFALRVLYTHWHAPTEFGTLRVSLEKIDVVPAPVQIIAHVRGSIDMTSKHASKVHPTKTFDLDLLVINANIKTVELPVNNVNVIMNTNETRASSFLVSVSTSRLEAQEIIGDEELDVFAVLFGRKYSAMLARIWAPVSPLFIFGTVYARLLYLYGEEKHRMGFLTEKLFLMLTCFLHELWYHVECIPARCYISWYVRMIPLCLMGVQGFLRIYAHVEQFSFEYLFLVGQIVCVAGSGFLLFDRTIDRLGVVGVCGVAMVIQSFDAVRTKSRARSSMSAVIGSFPWLVVGVYCYLVHPSVYLYYYMLRRSIYAIKRKLRQC